MLLVQWNRDDNKWTWKKPVHHDLRWILLPNAPAYLQITHSPPERNSDPSSRCKCTHNGEVAAHFPKIKPEVVPFSSLIYVRPDAHSYSTVWLQYSVTVGGSAGFPQISPISAVMNGASQRCAGCVLVDTGKWKSAFRSEIRSSTEKTAQSSVTSCCVVWLLLLLRLQEGNHAL